MKRYKTTLSLLIYLIIALILYSVPQLSIINNILKPVEVFFHETGHLLTALMYNAKISGLHLELGSGHVSYMISSPSSLVAFMGYVSASLAGFLIYISSLYENKILKFLILAYCSFFLIYVDGIVTALILSLIILIFLAAWYLKKYGYYLIRFIGVYVMMASIYSPTYLWAYDDTGDHVSLSDMTYLPSFVFILVWFFIGLFFLWQSFIFSRKFDLKKEIDEKIE